MEYANHALTRIDDRLSTFLDVLSERRRQIILAHVAESRGASLNELTQAVIDIELSEPTGTDEQLRLFSDVRSRHVPALLDAELVRYDISRDIVVPTPMADFLVDHLEQTAAATHDG